MMALITKHQNRFGQKTTHYWRYNGIVTSANRQPDGAMSVPTIAIFRAYDSEEAFKAGFEWMEERSIIFTPSSANADMAAEAYAAFKAAEPPDELVQQCARAAEAIPHLEAYVSSIEALLADAHEEAMAAQKAAGDVREEDAQGTEEAARRVRLTAARVAELTGQAERAAAALSSGQGMLSMAEAEQAKYAAWTATMAKAKRA